MGKGLKGGRGVLRRADRRNANIPSVPLPLHFVDLCSFPRNEISNDQSLVYTLKSSLIGLHWAASACLLRRLTPEQLSEQLWSCQDRDGASVLRPQATLSNSLTPRFEPTICFYSCELHTDEQRQQITIWCYLFFPGSLLSRCPILRLVGG